MHNFLSLKDEADKPIGFYDSGVGGISVLYETMRVLPNEDYVYYGDNLNAPYGQKDEATIRELSLKCADFLYKNNVKSIVIACNTATTVVVNAMREVYNLPVFSMEPAIKPAKEFHKQGTILVMATNATLRQQRYNTLIEKLHLKERIINIACPELVELVEKDDINGRHMKEYLKKVMQSVENPENICAIVLGCTHFAHAEAQIREAAKSFLNPDCVIYDGRYGTAKYIKNHLNDLNLLCKKQKAGSVKFFSSAENNYNEVLKRMCAK